MFKDIFKRSICFKFLSISMIVVILFCGCTPNQTVKSIASDPISSVVEISKLEVFSDIASIDEMPSSVEATEPPIYLPDSLKEQSETSSSSDVSASMPELSPAPKIATAYLHKGVPEGFNSDDFYATEDTYHIEISVAENKCPRYIFTVDTKGIEEVLKIKTYKSINSFGDDNLQIVLSNPFEFDSTLIEELANNKEPIILNIIGMTTSDELSQTSDNMYLKAGGDKFTFNK